LFPEFIPWYRGYKGDIDRDTDTRFICYGIVEDGFGNTAEIKELPIGMWTTKFSDFCQDLKADGKIKNFSNYSSPDDVHFILTETNEFTCDLNTLKLHSYLYTSNMVMFNEDNQLCKYDTVDMILDNFCKVRYNYYTKRKIYQMNSLKEELDFLGNKERFIQEVIDEELIIMNEKEQDIIKELKLRGYDEDPKKNNDEGGYDYLLRLQLRTFTKDKVKQLKSDIASLKKKLKQVTSTTEKNMWLNDLTEFQIAYEKWVQTLEDKNK
jgi:DNA topoisomerase-2